MVKYKIDWGHPGCYYQHYNETIAIGKMEYNNLTNDEYMQYLNDAITHEYIHHVMSKYFDDVTSTLFDTIAHYFRDMELLHKIVPDNGITHQDNILLNGIGAWLSSRGITPEGIKKSREITQYRNQTRYGV